ncbi:hypothetical protein [Endozoicomonas elysicola]|uniref:Uncharacterized protein n=1 Tax=Endozoicomonas elysicola TaxID=305900 RepID=A0A081K8B1_9GAMM|nr:hypothetical protein [Endozoicomonas elysicola]KEI70387.1 hypothetical protein GV64_06270 [Endozoicomonas elysicola]
MPCNLLEAARYQLNGSEMMNYRFTTHYGPVYPTPLVFTKSEIYFGAGLSSRFEPLPKSYQMFHLVWVANAIFKRQVEKKLTFPS